MSHTRTTHRPSFRPHCEALEHRWTPSCSVRLEAGTLHVQGDALANRVAVLDEGERGVSVACDDPVPHLYPGPISHVVIDTGAGNDTVQYGIIDPNQRPRSFEARLGDGDDAFSLLAPRGLTIPRGGEPPAFRVQAGDGADRVTARLGHVTGSLTVLAEGGGGNDFLMFHEVDESQGTLTATLNGGDGDDWLMIHEVEAQGSVMLTLDGGAGNDNLLARVGFNPQPDPPGRSQLTAHGGAGNDRIDIVGFNPQPDPPGSSFVIDVQGGLGNDDILLDYRGFVGGALRALLDGGDGHDRIFAHVAASPGSRGTVDIALQGGLGNDFLGLLLGGPDTMPVTALVDGGAGFDITLHTRNVRAVNCEIDVPLG